MQRAVGVARRSPTIPLLLVLSLAACGPLPTPGAKGELVVATYNSLTTYYLDADGQPTGFEHDLVMRFAESQGWKVRFVPMNNLGEIFRAVRNGRVHLAAAGLTINAERAQHMAFGPPYGKVDEWVVCREGVPSPKDSAGLRGLRLEVVADSSHVVHLRQTRRKNPGMVWIEMKDAGQQDLLERVDAGLADCSIADSGSLDVARNYHPSLRDAFVLAKGQKQAWALRQGVDVSFSRRITDFFRGVEKSGELARLQERYFGHVKRLEEADVRGILERRVERLHPLRGHFHTAQMETGLDWRLIAAIAYQESQWNAHAVSPTGVRGIMMLTADTADRLGVQNRLDPHESILGGARYLALLKALLPETVPEPDRTWMALAAYNIGPAHLEDARGLARRLGKNPDQWRDLKEVLPLLTRSSYYGSLRYGFARGGEARTFAENTRIYFDILNRFEATYRSGWMLK